MPTISIEEAQTQLPQLIERVQQGEDIVITRDEIAVARLVIADEKKTGRRQLGFLKGSVLHMAPDFDAPLEDFKEYME